MSCIRNTFRCILGHAGQQKSSIPVLVYAKTCFSRTRPERHFNTKGSQEPVIAHLAQSWPQKRKAIIIAKYMEDSVVKSVDILLKDNLIRNLKKKLHQNQTKNKRSIPESMKIPISAPLGLQFPNGWRQTLHFQSQALFCSQDHYVKIPWKQVNWNKSYCTETYKKYHFQTFWAPS